MEQTRNSGFKILLLSAVLTTFSSWVAATAQAENTEVILRLQGKVSMAELAKSVSDPASPRFHKFYTPAEIRSLAAPTDAEYSALVAELAGKGVTIVRESPTHMTLTVQGDRDQLASIQDRTQATFSRLVTSSPLDSVANVNGLSSGPRRHSHLKFYAKKPTATFTGFLPAAIRKAYGLDTVYAAGITGKGQTIAIATYDGFKVADVTDYYSKNGITPGPTVTQVNFNGTAAFDPGSAAETQTDAEFSGMIAPGASILVFPSTANTDAGELAMFTAILDDGRANVVNYSWGSCEKDVVASHKTDMDAVFARAIAQGINITIATGDSGSDCEGDGSTVADFPATSPDVIAVGGTTLALDSNGLATETAWADSGGGISALYGPASFQSALAAPYNANRSYPDVAFNADPNSGQPTWLHYDPNNPTVTPKSASYIVIGGTSIAAPQWSGFLALVGEARAGKRLGSLTAAVYPLGSQNQADNFDDVTSGSNGAYTAGAGWDAVTGWGSMKADALLTYLKGI